MSNEIEILLGLKTPKKIKKTRTEITATEFRKLFLTEMKQYKIKLWTLLESKS